MKILLADDNPDARAMLSAAFRVSRHAITEAADGAEAVACVQQQFFDAMILDIGMPLMNGWEATQTIRKIPHAATVPIILFTGYNEYYDQAKAEAVGATLLLHKPFDPLTLVKMVEAYVKKMAPQLQPNS